MRFAVPLGRLAVLLHLVFSPGARQEVSRNYRRIFGRDRPGFWLRQGWTLGRNLALMARMGTDALNRLLDNAEFTGDNIPETMAGDGRVIVLSLHYGLWELLPQAYARRGYRVCVGMGVQRDDAFGNRLSKLRASNGAVFTDSVFELRQAMRRRDVLGFVVDNTSRTRSLACDTIWDGFQVLRTPFFLAQTEQASLVPVFMYFDRQRLKVEVGPPVATADEFGLRARAMIEKRPEEWVFWGKASEGNPDVQVPISSQ